MVDISKAYAKLTDEGNCWLIVIDQEGYSIGAEQYVKGRWSRVIGMGKTIQEAWDSVSSF